MLSDQSLVPSTELTRETARRIINRLAEGTPPEEGLEILTAGRERWLASVDEDLEFLSSGDSRVRIFNGRYGDGKTHLMKLVRLLAFRRGFPVSYVAIRKEVPLNRWDQLYREIVRSIHTSARRERRGLTSILDPVDPDPSIAAALKGHIEEIRRLPDIHPDFATAVYRLFTQQVTSVDQQQDTLTLRSWLEGQKISRQVLRSLSISGSIERDSAPAMLKSMSIFFRLLGISGMVLLLDEIESTLSQPRPARGQAYENLRLFVDRENIPQQCLIAMSSTPEMFSDSDRGFSSYPALWRRIRGLEPSGEVNYRATVVDLTRTPLTSADLLEVGRRIRSVHAIAREWDPNGRVSDDYLASAAKLAASGQLTLTFSPTGVFVKFVTEELETAHQSPGYTPSAEELRRRFSAVDQALGYTHTPEQW